MLRARPSGQVVAALGDQLEREIRTEAIDPGDIFAEQFEQRRSDIKIQRVCRARHASAGRRDWGGAAIPIEAEFLQHSFYPGVAGQYLLLV